MLRSVARAAYWAGLNHWYALRRFRGARIEPSVQWRGPGVVRLAPGGYVGAGTVVDCAAGATIDIGRQAWIGRDCEISSTGHVLIGEHSSLQHRTQVHGDVSIGAGFTGAAGVYISSGWHEFRRQPFLPVRLQDRIKGQSPAAARSLPVHIGEDCWLGIGVAVMPGVTIGRGCVVGAQSVVTRDLPPYSIAAGAPARVLGQRLAFGPPQTLDALDDAHLPYFYAGFRQIGADSVPPRQRGGLVAHAHFVVASPAADHDVVELEIDTRCEGRLRHGDQDLAFPRGTSRVRFDARPTAAGLMAFEWLAGPGAGDDAVVLRRFGLVATDAVR